ncbi:hypothetical protein R5R35_006991 [Gryllus longicercus]|uniref:Protein rolling stone n=1 Tax=Gryllus longicercus TaxID=2509291 RepID=A0AAN9Z284_9ORTH
MVNELWKREFRPHFFRVEHHKPHQFVLCQWQSQEEVHIGYFFYRWFMAAVFLISMICSICDVGRSADFGIKYKKWAIYLTNWGYTICTLQAILGASLITQQFLQQKRQGKYIPVRKRLPIGYQLYWVFHTIAVVLALGITVVYWATVYSPENHRLDVLNVLVHACNSIFMLIDFLLVAHPFRLLHCYWPFLFTGCYVFFNFVYYEFGGTDRHERSYIYPLLDWRRPRRSILATVFGLIFVLAVHCVVWVLFLLRRWVAVAMNKKSDPEASGDICQATSTSIQMDVVEC